MYAKKHVVVPKEFLKSIRIGNENIQPSEFLITNLIQSKKNTNNSYRGKSTKNEPDINVNGEWIEITTSETEAQKTLALDQNFLELRYLDRVFDDIIKAIDKKCKKKYSVPKFSIAVLCYDYAPYMYEKDLDDIIGNVLIDRSIDFYNELYLNYLKNERILNIYLIFVEERKTNIVVDVKEEYENGDGIYKIDYLNEDYYYPYVEAD